MKLELITLHAVKNYGSVLQAFATQELFENYGLDVKIINYEKFESRFENLLKYWANGNFIKAIAIFPTIVRWKRVFGEFCKEFLNISGPIYTSSQDFKNYPITADLYCTGSDQVWNSKWNNGILEPLYLNFVPKEKFKFSFAASFGQEYLIDSEVKCTKEYMNQYKYISVREATAKKIVEEQYGILDVTHIIDPTLCVDGEFWRKYKKSRPIDEEYILVYNLNRSNEFDKYAKTLAKKTGLKLVRLCTRYDQILRIGKSILIPEVFEFIGLIDNARYVLTDSFHATAFAINLNTEPICIYPDEFGGRIKSFLQMIDSENRHVKDYADFDVINRKVDFNKVNHILKNERAKVDDYISKVIDSAKVFYGIDV